MHRPNLQVLTQAQARRVVIESGCAVGLEFLHDGRVKQVRARREVLLCGGAYGSPQLLMVSGIGPAAELQRHGIGVIADLPGVGANLIEHPRMMLQYRASRPVTFTRQLRLDRATLSALRWALFGTGPFATQICSGTVLLRTDPALDRPDIQLLCNPVRLDAGLWFPGVVKPKEHSFYITVCQLHAKSRGRVTLRSADPFEAPRIALNLFSHPDDFTSMRNGLRAAREIYRQTPMADLIDVETIPGAQHQSDDEIDATIREFGGITHHPVGTCAMGTGADAVVDPQLRVRGLQGLRVVDASVMPTITSGNTNAATLMIGEKASDLILGRSVVPARLAERADLATLAN
jgi:choline dehydrogenase